LITGNIVDVLSNILSVRLFVNKLHEKRYLNNVFKRSIKAEQKMVFSYFWMWVYYNISFLVLQAINFFFLCQGRKVGQITVGDFALVLTINIAIFDWIWQLAVYFSQFSALFGRIIQALKVILEKSDVKDQPNASKIDLAHGTICFKKVDFFYKGDKEATLKNCSVSIKAGQKVGLVGYSGSGKTTFVNLILRLYDVKKGSILIDEQDIRKVTQDSLRSKIGVIPQDLSLFNRALIENIRYGKIIATDEEVFIASKLAQAHEFISKLPLKYHTLVGERGIKLSGGQRQRIAIARVILKNAPILILDEATSQLDSVTEHYIQKNLWKLMRNKTAIVIAHRLSTLLGMDRILLFDNGRIIADGTHAELLKNSKLYKKIWNAQVEGKLVDK
jgi:ATP-binding cassette subfamily B protein